ncbi:DUF6036 family nucleotidyltransferase [Rhodospirillum rubrum]|uniref:DUF6036 domain-containing protein n=1 Tax=Rhodospirillum rubrum (strain ATCC 11170 / ATH 1.1.1 / DSM 467 / LMG 4362 / NCIMB 8255 / S1) TaxID=269796 RepID=Q2RR41_RHORT|nr:DUF6036 family nucleotidyltransferase [Rhodospirillum rubrum]ABC23404.1 hypothetical protein Rru_A2607 [Rhodospirillum rubrum ATCC 11170]AEO49140.1 hypothetical protein F11_13390 [Rhodospirillum rubrum F11]MBK5955054.1 hypothetical protein [Rhodospirillum rubrum]QXG79376.1 hypothetical protein KUL73_13445 [Rhodospirillum rubrum]HAQ00978.1 hypothetical protein [Rhodospirillum rubrum]
MTAGIDRDTIENLLINLGQHLSKPTQLCVIGSSAALIAGQAERQTLDIDVWNPKSDFDVGDLKRACENSGVLYDPKGEIDPTALYLQVIRPGIVSLPMDFPVETLGRYGNLTLVMPPPDLIVAAKLSRGEDRDLEDAVWWVRGRGLTEHRIEAAIDQLPNDFDRETAKENMVFIKLATK